MKVGCADITHDAPNRIPRPRIDDLVDRHVSQDRAGNMDQLESSVIALRKAQVDF